VKFFAVIFRQPDHHQDALPLPVREYRAGYAGLFTGSFFTGIISKNPDNFYEKNSPQAG
jgi:hypothetical protein